MNIRLVISVTGQYKIYDENTPLLTLYNDFNNYDFAISIMDYIRNKSKKIEAESIKQSFIGDCKFEYLDIEEK